MKSLFQISLRNFGRKPKNIQKNGVNIDQIAMCYISMDLSQRAQQTNGKLFSNFKLVFGILAENRIPTNREARILIEVQCIIYF